MKAIYTRISTQNQNDTIQLLGSEDFQTYSDTCKGTIPFIERTFGKRLMYDISKGVISEVHVLSIDRLGRNLLDIINTIEFFTAHNIQFFAKRECLQSHIDGKINPVFKLNLCLLASVAEFEKQRINERTSEGRKQAVKEGKFKGRKVGTIESETVILNKTKNIKAVSLIKKGLSLNDIIDRTGLSKPTIIKLKKIVLKQ